MFPAVSVCESVYGMLNKQLSISVNRARCMPEAQVAQLQVDTLSCEQKPRPIFLYPNRAVGKETLNVMLVDVWRANTVGELLLRQRQSYLHALAAGGLIHLVHEGDKELERWCWGQRPTDFWHFTICLFCSFLLPSGWEDPSEVDSTRGHRIQEVHLGQWRVELWHRHVGSDVIWREALLGYVQPGCKFICKHQKNHEHWVITFSMWCISF